MAYDVWLSLRTRDLLDYFKQNNPKTYYKISEELNKLSIQREDFRTGVPEKVEVFVINSWKVYYRILPRLKSIDVIDIRECL